MGHKAFKSDNIGETVVDLKATSVTVTGSKLGQSLNDDCVLPGWARDLWFFLCTAMDLKINLTKLHSPA